MANDQGPGFVDKHIEKVILAVCGLILIYAVVQDGISTPRRIEGVKGDPPPAEVDSILLQEAQRVRYLVESEDPPEHSKLTYIGIFKELETNPISEKLASLNFGTPLVKGLGGGGVTVTKAPTLEGMLKVVPAPRKPVNWCESELVNVSKDPNEIKLEENPTWRSVTYYPWGELAAAWKKELKDSVIYPQLTAVRYEVEIEEKQLDGTWKIVDSVKPVYRPDSENLDKNGEEMFPPQIPPYRVSAEDGIDNASQINEAIQEVSSFTESQLQPDYFDIWTSQGQDVWQKHMPLKTIAAWYKGHWEASKDGVDTREAPRREVRTRQPVMDPRMGPGMMGPGMMGPGMLPGRRVVQETAPRRMRSRVAGAGSKFLPDYDTQRQAGKVLAWFHSDKIQYGHEYRCRFRLIFVNPLLTSIDDVDKSKPQDAKIPTITTKWSPWSDPVEVARDMQFFVTGSSASSKTFSATIFTKVLGQLVSGRFGRIGVGEPIGGIASVAVINPATGETEEPQIEFSTGAIAVSLNFQKELVLLTRSGRYIKRTTELIYMDQDGKLHSRVMYDDQHNKTYRAMRDEVKEKAPRTAREIELEEKRIKRLEDQERRKTERKRTPAGTGPGIPDAPPGGFPGAP